jgi:hypothetical protein
MTKYYQYDWDELPEEQKKEASLLGYTKETWDNDGNTTASNKDWDDLTPVEKAAAKALGYDEKKWDE